MLITEPTVLIKGVSARPNSTGFVTVDLHYSADRVAFTPDVIEKHKLEMPGWRWRKEYELDFGAQAGVPVFDADAIAHQKQQQRNPLWRMDINPDGVLTRRDSGRVRIYHAPDEQPRELPARTVRVRRAFGAGIDVGEGVEKSDSTIEVFFADTREQAAEFVCNRTSPSDLGRIAAAIGRYYNDALICCVRKMHGITTIRTMVDECHYLHQWHSRIMDQVAERQTDKLGWARGESSSSLLFGKWSDALTRRKTTLHSIEAVEQHEQYIYDERGRVTHQRLVNESAEVRERHGDMVVACALAWRACSDLPAYRRVMREQPSFIDEELAREAAEDRAVWRTTA